MLSSQRKRQLSFPASVTWVRKLRKASNSEVTISSRQVESVKTSDGSSYLGCPFLMSLQLAQLGLWTYSYNGEEVCFKTEINGFPFRQILYFV